MSNSDYRNGRFWVRGKPRFLVAAEYQYYRDRREHWKDRLTKLKRSGVEAVSFYIPWRHHLVAADGPQRFDFAGTTRDNRDVRGFMDAIANQSLSFIAKPGPFVHSELNVGGLPDCVSPSFTKDVPAARRWDGAAAMWEYDETILPAPLAAGFESLAEEWLRAVGELLRPYSTRGGPLIAVQLNDETIFCTSNDPPWQFGYDEDGLRFYRELLREQYGEIEHYNRLHATAFESFDEVQGPSPIVAGSTAEVAARRLEDLTAFVDWAEYQWRLRRDLYLRYRSWLGLDLPHLTNFAGITPPIEENIPGKEDEPPPSSRPLHPHLYPEWWFAMNRIDEDAAAYEYGFISWLGVAAYDPDVFDRYVNTARRAPGINMEENWGFGTLYDSRSRHALVPFFQTLLSVAAGATGYVIFVGVGSDYWDDDLDRITKIQCPTFPSHAPIDEEGRCGPLYDAATLLNGWFRNHGSDLLQCCHEPDVAFLLYPPYAAVSSWIPDKEAWGLTHDIPRCGREGFEEFSKSLQEAGYSYSVFELGPASMEKLKGCPVLAMQSGFFMGREEQEKLAALVEAGRTLLFISGELPRVDTQWRPCTVLAEAVEKVRHDPANRVIYSRENHFASGRFADRLAEHGIEPRIRCSPALRTFLHRGKDDAFVFFFRLADGLSEGERIEFDGITIDLSLGPRTCGALRFQRGRLTSALVKGRNEIEGVDAPVEIRAGGVVLSGKGDWRVG